MNIERIVVPDPVLDAAEAKARAHLIELQIEQRRLIEVAHDAYADGDRLTARKYRLRAEALYDGPIMAAIKLLVDIDMCRPFVFREVPAEGGGE